MDLTTVETTIAAIEEFAPIGEQLLNMGLSASGIAASNMSRISALENVVSDMMKAFAADAGKVFGTSVTVHPSPKALVAAAPAPKHATDTPTK